MQALTGHLLIAPLHLTDPDFIEAVILVVQHSEAQAFGVTLNRPTPRTVKEAWQGGKPPECYQWVYSGGPVPGPLLALHGNPLLAEMEILPGVYYSIQKTNLERIVRQPEHAFKVFNSHAGWGPGQLERWIEEGQWRARRATFEQVFDTGPSLWNDLTRFA